MKVLQVNILFLLLSSLCCSKSNSDVISVPTTVLSSSISATQAVSTSSITQSTELVTQSTTGTSPKGTTTSEFSETPLLTTISSLTTTGKGEGYTTNATKNEFIMTNATVTNSLLTNSVSTLKSSQHKTENQSTIKTTERQVTIQPDASSSKTSALPSTSRSENISESQGTENGKNASAASSTNPSYSSIILPVVIALIVITLSVFVLVGLYRMCWKTDPGTPENGNDQPQSDKESVKLLTVKTISLESGEQSAQGKTKN
ncbi:endomucin [Choloepus didactylus]|uniref:endomucin n=1 Tax=Choloepus didactylus TaxID=27675 RepID=UPI0018A0DAEA|nr:endomucin [Choloepus didactylus]XP_037686264.1 endomucin [Choloepus didactylus]